MDEEVSRYREALLGEIQADAVAGGDYLATRFIDRACQVLESGEEFIEYSLCRAHGQTRRGGHIQIDAYSYSPSDGVLSFVVCEFSGAADPVPMMTDEVKRLVQGAYRFLEGSVHDSIADLWDESHPAHALARETFSLASSSDITKVCIYLVSDRPLGTSTGKIPELSLGTTEVQVQIWDIARLARVEASIGGREQIAIDFISEYQEGIPALPVGLDETSHYDSYMCVMPGRILADLYDRFGGRILEQNVRAFLGDSRKVNRGIRDTLRTQPERFFAFNNGLTVTVSGLDTAIHALGHTEIVKVSDLQIVNGGQTTASLYWARKAGLDLSKVRVQMKLSRLPEEGFEDAVHNIARFANAQNAVSASDLFAGHPYFKRLEGMSRQTLAPPGKPGDAPSYWYFERTTGSYKVELRRKTGLAAKTWQLLNPKKQLLTKTDVARYEATFENMPHQVSSGAQKNIAAFGKIIEKAWNADPTTFDLFYYQRLVCRAILARALDAAIPAQEWYPGSILRPLTTYTLSLMSSRMRESGLQPSYSDLWKLQQAPTAFMREALRIARLVLPLLQEIPEEQVRNRLITEWVKREACWHRVVESDIQLSDEFKSTLVAEQHASGRRENWQTKALLLWKAGTWKRVNDWNRREEALTPGEAELVEWAAVTSEFKPRGLRLTKLREAWDRAVEHGFV